MSYTCEDSKCPNCGSTSVVKGVNGNSYVLYNKGTQNLHNCTGSENAWSNYAAIGKKGTPPKIDLW